MLPLYKIINEYVFFPLRRLWLVQLLSQHVASFETVLDLGSSDGKLAYEISKVVPTVKFVGVDTYVQPKTFIPIKKYDGKHLPFPDNSFDCVMIVDVLHHDADILSVLKEASRVAKKKIIIKDHHWNTRFDYQVLRSLDYIGNKPYDIALPYNYLQIAEWQAIFKKLKLKTAIEKMFRYINVVPGKHVLFVLDK